MTDPFETTDLLSRYRWCRLGFSLSAVASGVMAFHAAGVTLFYLTWYPSLRQFLNSSDWLLAATSVITWASLLGSLVLLRCWPERFWGQRVGVLLTTCLLSAVIWVVRHAVRFGLASEPIPHTDLLIHVALGLRWVWLAVLSGLAAEVAVHLGDRGARRLRAAIMATVTAGVAFWILTLLIDMMPGMMPRRPRDFVAIWMQILGFWGLYCASGFSTTILLLTASRECTRIARELKRDADMLHTA